ncbi:hypothetical protein NSND_62696 [Nitrospira sp. ND1]|nr:hypothetical protein NSND_62696 [Nitrospira sp. ND1]
MDRRSCRPYRFGALCTDDSIISTAGWRGVPLCVQGVVVIRGTSVRGRLYSIRSRAS